MLVSFSGIDSAGKTTQIRLLEEYCKQNGIPTRRIWAKARGTPGVLLCKRILRRDKTLSATEKADYRARFFRSRSKKKLLLIASLLDLCWYFGIYYRLLSLLPSLTILDRYLWDTYVEIKTEFTGITFERWWLWRFLRAVSPRPRISFLFTISAKESLRRDIEKRDLSVDSLRLKKEKLQLYRRLADQHKWTHVMDGMRTVEALHADVLRILNPVAKE